MRSPERRLLSWTAAVALGACATHPAAPLAPAPPALSTPDASEAGVTAAPAQPPTAPLAAGSFHTCAISAADEVRCWGDNDHGQLGLGRISREEPAGVVQGLRDVTQLAAGNDQTCALDRSGGAWCWGQSLRRPLMETQRPDRAAPVRIDGLPQARAIAVGGYHTCALLRDDTVWCWGQNDQGQLGDGTRTDREAPGPVSLPWPAAGLSAGSYTTCAFSAGGEVACWGMHFDVAPGKSGADFTSKQLTVPTVVRHVDGVAQLAVGFHHVCARTERGGRGGVVCWGDNRSGQFGSGLPPPGGLSSIPEIDDARDLAQGDATCALLRQGGVRCWGSSNSVVDRAKPAITGADALAVGGTHACVLLAGAALCWGQNDRRQLGDGTPEARSQPVAVLAPGAPLPPVSANGEGDACGQDADCGWDDPCAPSRCGGIASTRAVASCLSRPVPPGDCVCLHSRCVLHPSSPPPPPAEACTLRTCGLDEGAGRCLVGRGTATNPAGRVTEGPFCTCDQASHCAYTWIAPVPCRSPDDCWIEVGSPSHPIRRPPEIHHPFKPCVDGETPPVCRDGVCGFGRPYGC